MIGKPSAEIDGLDIEQLCSEIHDASTLDEAIFWRQAMMTRMQKLLDRESGSSKHAELYRVALVNLEIALAHLRLSQLNEERMDWSSDIRAWVSTNVWNS